MSDDVTNVKERLSIDEVVGQYVALKPAGVNLKAVCPFHSEKTPSFTVSVPRQTYHCFGCGAHGDVFTFIQEMEGLDFPSALKLLADKAGVQLTNTGSTKNTEQKNVLLRLLEEASVFYEKKFAEHTEAQKYLQDRGLSESTIRTFRLGFAPDAWEGASKALLEKGYEAEDIEKAGLTKKGDKGTYDRFRSRIMFPIANSNGDVVAFSGRIFGKEDVGGKYINSPETALYHKSKLLYGYDRARQAIRKNNFSVVVEGQMDLLAAHQSGYTNTVALSGTALTPEHLTLLGRMSKNVVLALDADEAGIASAGKSARAALRSGFDVKVAKLPEGKDPADLLASGDMAAWKETVKNAQHVIDFLLGVYRKAAKDERSFKLTVEREVLPYLHDIVSEIDKTHFIQKVATELAVSEEAIRSQLRKTPMIETPAVRTDASDAQNSEAHVEQHMETEYELVRLYVWQKNVEKPYVDVTKLKKSIEGILTPNGFEAITQQVAEDTEAAFRFEELFMTKEGTEEAIHELLARLEKDQLLKELEKATTALRKAEISEDAKKITESEEKCIALHKQIAALESG